MQRASSFSLGENIFYSFIIGYNTPISMNPNHIHLHELNPTMIDKFVRQMPPIFLFILLMSCGYANFCRGHIQVGLNCFMSSIKALHIYILYHIMQLVVNGQLHGRHALMLHEAVLGMCSVSRKLDINPKMRRSLLKTFLGIIRTWKIKAVHIYSVSWAQHLVQL